MNKKEIASSSLTANAMLTSSSSWDYGQSSLHLHLHQARGHAVWPGGQDRREFSAEEVLPYDHDIPSGL